MKFEQMTPGTMFKNAAGRVFIVKEIIGRKIILINQHGKEIETSVGRFMSGIKDELIVDSVLSKALYEPTQKEEEQS